MEKLYHGSRYFIQDTINPNKADANGGSQLDGLKAVYATNVFLLAALHGLPVYPNTPNIKGDALSRLDIMYQNREIIECKLSIIDGYCKPNDIVYIYELDMKDFVRIGIWQWVSLVSKKPQKCTAYEVIDFIEHIINVGGCKCITI